MCKRQTLIPMFRSTSVFYNEKDRALYSSALKIEGYLEALNLLKEIDRSIEKLTAQNKCARRPVAGGGKKKIIKSKIQEA